MGLLCFTVSVRFVVRRLFPAVTTDLVNAAIMKLHVIQIPPLRVASSRRPSITLSKSFVKPPPTPLRLIVTSHNSIIQRSKSKRCICLFHSLRH